MLPARTQGNIDRSDQSLRSKNSKDGIAPRHRRTLDRRNGANSRCFDWCREITTLSRTPEVTCDRESWAPVGSLHAESGRSSTRLTKTPVSEFADTIMRESLPLLALLCPEGFYRTDHSIGRTSRVHRVHAVVIRCAWL